MPYTWQLAGQGRGAGRRQPTETWHYGYETNTGACSRREETRTHGAHRTRPLAHRGVRGNEAADVLARRGTQIGDRDRIVELRSAEPPSEERGHLDYG